MANPIQAGDTLGREHEAALDSARRKAYWRLLPLLFACYVIAYVDRANVSIAKLTMSKDLAGFDNAVIGTAAGIFFVGYFLLEIPGSLICERWSAHKWIARIMITWGIAAACTAMVKTPNQFYGVRFLLGLAEAGFFPGVLVFLTHWFPSRDRARALSYFIVGTPVAQLVSPKLSNILLRIGTTQVVNGVSVHHPQLMGMNGWQWVYIAWGIPAVVLGILVFVTLSDHPHQANWLSAEERDALERQLEVEKSLRAGRRRMSLVEAFKHPKVILLTLAFFCGVSANYGVEFFLPSILERWYALKLDSITSLILLPPILAISAQLFVGWNSDRTRERRLHSSIPALIAGLALLAAPMTQGHLPLTICCFVIFAAGIKGYQPAFWALPSIFLTEAAAAGSIGLINSVGNLGGYAGTYVVGKVETLTGKFDGGIYYLGASAIVCSVIAISLRFPKEPTLTPALSEPTPALAAKPRPT